MDNRARFIFSMTGSKWADPRKTDPNASVTDPSTVLNAVSFTGSEELSRLYRFEIEVVETHDGDPKLVFDDIVDKNATLTLYSKDEPRYVYGIVSNISLRAATADTATYSLSLVPPHFRATLRQNLRIFQNKTTQEIITEVLGEWKISELKWELTESYKPRNYCVQYRESDFQFISRLLEEEGIYYYFEHTADSVQTVFVDNKDSRPTIVGDATVPFNPDQAVKGYDHVKNFVMGQSVRTGKVERRDYWFRSAAIPHPIGQAEGVAADYEDYDYPGEFSDDGLGSRLARVRLEELEQDREVGHGVSDCARMQPGRTFNLGDPENPALRHKASRLNQSYYLISVQHTGSQAMLTDTAGQDGSSSYQNSLTVIPAGTPYRPPRRVPNPRAIGNHTAQVVGPEQDEIYTDEYGRVKVAFHWDRDQWSNKSDKGYSGWREPDEKASCWVRVSQFWAGQGYGALFLPRVGQEVLVSFIDGDPDRPLVTGRVYNDVQEVPGLIGGTYGPKNLKFEKGPPELLEDEADKPGLPINKTRSVIRTSSSKGGEGSNEIRFEDKAGQEHIYIHAQKDYFVEVEHNRHSLVRANRAELVNHNDKLWVNNDRFVHVQQTSHQTAKNVVIQASDKIIFEVGSSRIEMDPSSITITTSDKIVVNPGSLLKMWGGSKTKIGNG